MSMKKMMFEFLNEENAKLSELVTELSKKCQMLELQEIVYKEFIESLTPSDKSIMGEWCKSCKHYRKKHIPKRHSEELFSYCAKHLPEICKEFECEEITE